MRIVDKRFLLLFTVLLVTWAYVYADALISMEAIWRRSDTFAHGYFILPISAWLLWRDKNYLRSSVVQSSWYALPFLAGSLVIWLFAYAADINVLGQLSAVVSFIGIIWLLIGNKLTWRYKFPLAYLLFCVPMGENLIPWLQDITAWFTVLFLKLNGIPVFRDGLYLQIPSGLFEVAVACSGIRYLIASVAVGTIFAYLTYTSVKKQLLFMLFSLLLPILANGIRAYGMVAIAHYSDMKYAVGFDHLVYGWLFFGLVIMLMFYIGGKFADSERPTLNSGKILTGASKYSVIPSGVALACLLLISLLFHAIQVVNNPAVPAMALQGQPVQNSNWGITFSDGLQRSHIAIQENIEAFRAVYANKQSGGELVSWNNQLYNPKHWTVIEEKQIMINEHPANYVFLRSANGTERAVVYWYQIANLIAVDSHKVKLLQAWFSFWQPNANGEIMALSVANLTQGKALEAIHQQSVTISALIIDTTGENTDAS